jgi:single-strand DNA-binding protein
MSDLNHVFLIGRLTRDAELKHTSAGQAVCKFSLAVNESRKTGDRWKDEASYFEAVLWGQPGESLNQYLVKGKQVAVSGKLRQERWDQDGKPRSRVVITAESIQLLGGNPGGGEGGPPRTKGGGAAPASDDGFADDIPF